MTDPLTPEEEAALRQALSESNGPNDDVGYAVFADAEDAETVAARLLATLDAARQTPPEPAIGEHEDHAGRYPAQPGECELCDDLYHDESVRAAPGDAGARWTDPEPKDRVLTQETLAQALIDITRDPNTHEPTEHPDYWRWVAEHIAVAFALDARGWSRDSDLRAAAQEALGWLDKVSPAGWHVERARDALLAALAKPGGTE